jgi:hypothetical protein
VARKNRSTKEKLRRDETPLCSTSVLLPNAESISFFVFLKRCRCRFGHLDALPPQHLFALMVLSVPKSAPRGRQKAFQFFRPLEKLKAQKAKKEEKKSSADPFLFVCLFLHEGDTRAPNNSVHRYQQ